MYTSLLALAGFGIALLVTGVTTPVVRRLALRWLWTDSPDGERKRHTSPTPSAGGLAIVAGVVVALAVLALASAALGIGFLSLHPVVYLGAAAMVAVGALDDARGLSFKPKLLVECVLAYALVHAGYRVDLSGFAVFGGDPYTEALWTLPLTLLWIVGVINAVNLIDGVDGLAAGVAAIAFASLAAVFGGADPALVLLAAVLIGALGGFLIHNFNPASIFMGDSGSLFLGYALAVFSLSGTSGAAPTLAPLVPALALGLPLFDTALSMARRVAEGRAMFAPDCDHIHHRMTDLLSVRRSVLVLYGIAAVFGAAAVAVGALPLVPALLVLAGTVGAMVAVVVMLGYTRRVYQPPAISQIQLIREPADARPAGSSDLVPVGLLDAPPSSRPAERSRPSGDGSSASEPAWRIRSTRAH